MKRISYLSLAHFTFTVQVGSAFVQHLPAGRCRVTGPLVGLSNGSRRYMHVAKSDMNNSTEAVGLPNVLGAAASSLPLNPSSQWGKPIPEGLQNFNKASIGFVKNAVFDNIFRNESNDRQRDYARFYALEKIARVPYFSYMSVLHLFETLGWWRRAKYLKIHFAESWNELHHLLIMEELGGDEVFFDRMVAQHVAVFYYFVVCTAYATNPTFAYNINEAVEEHAFETYDKFIKEHGEELAQFPAPKVAQDYYRDGDLYMFDEMHTSSSCEPPRRRPTCDTLLDVFRNIRDDEAQHVATMQHLQRAEMDISSVNNVDDDTCVVFE